VFSSFDCSIQSKYDRCTIMVSHLYLSAVYKCALFANILVEAGKWHFL
jgi:hypothetical protein